jgi:aminoglycoside/choline kinase family phosphotransferase
VSARAHRLEQFLAESGWADAERQPLVADASFRRYVRLRRGEASAMLMDAPPPREDVRPFVQIAALLAGDGFSAPRVLAADEVAGFLVLEDLGDETFTRALAAGADEAVLYRLATDLLIDLQRRVGGSVEGRLRPYDAAALDTEVALLADWYLPALRGRPLAARIRAAYLEAWHGAYAHTSKVPWTLVLRDYHVDNLMVLPGRTGLARCGLLDFQDALFGPCVYDLASLLEDARRDVSAALEEEMQARYLRAFPELQRDAFDAAYAVLGAQRSAKIIGIFTRLWKRDGKPAYLRHIPRVWRLLERDLAHPALAAVRRWFDAEVGPEERRAPVVGEKA